MKTTSVDDTVDGDFHLPDDDGEFVEATWRGQIKAEADWRRQGFAVAWADPRPTWLNILDWDTYAIKEPDRACVRIIRFSLIGGGQIRVQEKFCAPEHRHHFDDPEWADCFRYGHRLLIKAVTSDGLVQVSGTLREFHYEMDMVAVVLPAGYQEIADRAASMLRMILDEEGNPDAGNFMALLDGSKGCAFCARPLRDAVSKLIGVGPDCARRYGTAQLERAAIAS